MFDFLRNLTKSAEEKRQEALTAYLDNALSPRARQQFEGQLGQDPGLRAELEQQRTVRQMLSQLPPRRVPRNFTLDPALYGRPTRQPLVQYYPALRAATVLTAVLLFIAVGFGVYSGSSGGLAADVAMEAPMAAQEAAEPFSEAEGEPVIVTRIVVETVIETVIVEMAEESSEEEAEEALAEEEAAGEAASDTGTTAEPTLVASAPVSQATSAPLPSTTPLATATQSTLPRPEATDVAERAATAESGTTFSVPEPTAVAPLDADTAVTNIQPTPAVVVEPPGGRLVSPLAVVQIALLLLLVVLTAVTLYARRKL